MTRPVVRLVGYARVDLEPGESALVTFTVPADVTSFTGRSGARVVEPGDVELRVARSSADDSDALRAAARRRPARRSTTPRRLTTDVAVDPAAREGGDDA